MDFNKYKPAIERVDLGDGDVVHVRSLKAREFLKIRSVAKNDDDETGFQIVVRSLCNETGEPITTNMADVENLPIHVFNKLLIAALRVNGVNQEGFEDAKKKSAETPSVS